jgi:hypothetical protein
MAFTNRYSNLARPDVLLTEYRFHIHYMEKGLRKLTKNFDRDPTIGSKVMVLMNRYSSLARPDLLLTEYRIHIRYRENSIRKQGLLKLQ